mmetsp:Transcript_7252/g.23626  ORF Transcript_7252/g.23626 Transcript_7252/m.23626 type:complete len:296 (+) Transcript_7252:143-1030(+)
MVGGVSPITTRARGHVRRTRLQTAARPEIFLGSFPSWKLPPSTSSSAPSRTTKPSASSAPAFGLRTRCLVDFGEASFCASASCSRAFAASSANVFASATATAASRSRSAAARAVRSAFKSLASGAFATATAESLSRSAACRRATSRASFFSTFESASRAEVAFDASARACLARSSAAAAKRCSSEVHRPWISTCFLNLISWSESLTVKVCTSFLHQRVKASTSARCASTAPVSLLRESLSNCLACASISDRRVAAERASRLSRRDRCCSSREACVAASDRAAESAVSRAAACAVA